MTYTLTFTAPATDPITQSGDLPDGLEPISFLKMYLARFLFQHPLEQPGSTLTITFTQP